MTAYRYVSGIPLAVSAGAVVAVFVAGVKTTVVMLATTAYFISGTSFYSTAPRPAPTVEGAQQQLHGYTTQSITASKQSQYSSTIFPVSGLNAPTMGQSLRDGETKLNDELQTNPDTHVVVGESLGAGVQTVWLQHHANGADSSAPAADKLEFVMKASPSRPNGGILARFPGLYIPILDIPFVGATPQSQYKTTDIVKQYDGIGDFPEYPLNLLAVANALAGYFVLHPYYGDVDPTSPDNNVQVVGNTTYITVPTKHLPLLEPFRAMARLLGITKTPVLDAIEPVLKVLIETGYDRSNYGAATPAKLFPPVSRLIAAAPQLVDAVRQGVSSLTNPVASVVAPQVTASAVSPSATNRQQLQDTSKPKQELKQPKLPKLQLPKLPPIKLPNFFAPKAGDKNVQNTPSGSGTDKPATSAVSAPKHETADHKSSDSKSGD